MERPALLNVQHRISVSSNCDRPDSVLLNFILPLSSLSKAILLPFLNIPYVRCFDPSMQRYWETGELSRDGAEWEKSGPWAYALCGDIGTPVPSCSVLCFPTTRRWTGFPRHKPHLNVLPHHRPKTTRIKPMSCINKNYHLSLTFPSYNLIVSSRLSQCWKANTFFPLPFFLCLKNISME